MPRMTSITVEKVRIPKAYHIQDVSMFTQNWWKTITRTDFFWAQFKKNVSQRTLNERIRLEINAGEEADTQMKAKPKQAKTPARSRTASIPVPTMVSVQEEESDVDEVADVEEAEQGQEPQEAPVEQRELRRHRPPSGSYVPRYHCADCGVEIALSDMTEDEESKYICNGCRGIGPIGAYTPEIPTLAVDQQKPDEEPDTSQAPTGIKAEDLEEELIVSSTVAGVKRERDNKGDIVETPAGKFLLYIDTNGMPQAVRMEPSAKKIKIEQIELD